MSPDQYIDNVLRRERYEVKHPEVVISHTGFLWLAKVPDRGEAIERMSLGRLLDILEALDERP